MRNLLIIDSLLIFCSFIFKESENISPAESYFNPNITFINNFFNLFLKVTNVVAGGLNIQYHCFVITNINQYPDYLFIVLEKYKNTNYTLNNEVFKSSYCFYVSLFSPKTYAEVYALKKSEINLKEEIIQEKDDDGKEIERLKYFESQRAKLIPAKDKIYSLADTIIGGNAGIHTIYDDFEIRSISDTALVLRNKEEKYILIALGIISIAGALFGGIIYWKKSRQSKQVK